MTSTIETAPRRPTGRPEPPTWQLAAASFAPPGRRDRTHRLLAALPTLLILGVQVGLSVRLGNIANADEALYIRAGHEFLTQLSGGADAPSIYGGYFSGFPMAYPVLAGALDGVGGLALVRLVSLLMMLGATLCVGSLARSLAGPVRAQATGWAAMAFFVLSGPTLFVGHLATYDAASMLLVIAAATLAVVRRSLVSAALAGLLVALAGVCKYTGAAFVPVVVLLALLAHRPGRVSVARAVLIAVVGVGGLLAVYLPSASWIGPGIELTTSSRAASNPRSLGFLTLEYAAGVGLLTVLALAGLVAYVRRRRTVRAALLSLVLLGAGLAIPLGQMRIHEYTSFSKHLTFVAMFLAPLAGQVFAGRVLAPRSRVIKPLVLVLALYGLGVGALSRSDAFFHEWPDSTPVVEKILAEDVRGSYLGVGADSMGHYADDRPGLTFEEPYTLFGAGPSFMQAAIEQRRYAGVVWTTGETGSGPLDRDVALLARLVQNSPDYYLAGSWPKHEYDTNRFYLYLRRS